MEILKMKLVNLRKKRIYIHNRKLMNIKKREKYIKLIKLKIKAKNFKIKV